MYARMYASLCTDMHIYYRICITVLRQLENQRKFSQSHFRVLTTQITLVKHPHYKKTSKYFNKSTKGFWYFWHIEPRSGYL